MKSNHTINILCATDDNYVPYCGIMLTSVFENNKDVAVNAYVLIDNPLDKQNHRKMEKLAKKYGQKIYFVMVDNSKVKDYPSTYYWSIAMYYRMFAAELLPKEIDKILYFDCDVIVTSSLRQLYNIDLTNKAVAAVEDIFTYTDARQNMLGYPASAGYFNSGVLLMNLDYWREHKTGEKCIQFLVENFEKLEAQDQDVLNAILWDKRVQMPLTFNYQIQFLRKNFYDLQTESMRQEILCTYASSPIIIHYAYEIKPWSIMYYNIPFRKEWEHYRRISPWVFIKRVFPKRKTFNNIIKRFIMWPLGLMYHESGFIKP